MKELHEGDTVNVELFTGTVLYCAVIIHIPHLPMETWAFETSEKTMYFTNGPLVIKKV